MKSSINYKPNLSFGLLLQGSPKTGKTSLILSIPDLYIADCDNNLSGAMRFLREKNGSIPNFQYDTINIADDSQICKDLGLEPDQVVPSELRWSRLVECCKAASMDPKVKVIAVDSLSAINSYLQDHIVSKKSNDKEKYMTIGDWIPYKNMMTKFVTHFRSVGKPFIMTCHEEPDKAVGDVIMKYKPAMDGALKNSIGGFFSDVWCSNAEPAGDGFKYSVKCMPTMQRDLGNSLSLPAEFIFTWEGFKKKLDSYVAPQ